MQIPKSVYLWLLLSFVGIGCNNNTMLPLTSAAHSVVTARPVKVTASPRASRSTAIAFPSTRASRSSTVAAPSTALDVPSGAGGDTSVTGNHTSNLQVTPSPSSLAADLVLTFENDKQVVRVQLGQTIALVPAFQFDNWNLEYDQEMLTLLSPRENPQNPPESGWLFLVQGHGRSELGLHSPNGACPKGQRCAGMPNVDLRITLDSGE